MCDYAREAKFICHREIHITSYQNSVLRPGATNVIPLFTVAPLLTPSFRDHEGIIALQHNAILFGPANLLSNDLSEDALADITVLAVKIKREAEARPDTSNVKRGFNADAQRISISGDHQYVRHLLQEESSSKC
jgi:hypothetical protein